MDIKNKIHVEKMYKNLLKNFKTTFSTLNWLTAILSSLILVPIYLILSDYFLSIENSLPVVNGDNFINIIYLLIKYSVLCLFYTTWFTLFMYLVVIALKKVKVMIFRS